MKALKNAIAGFLISLIGSLPFGYLNIIGYDIYKSSGAANLAKYIVGIIAVEGIVVYCSLILAVKLTKKKRLIKTLEFLAIFFLLLLACYFYTNNGTESQGYTTDYLRSLPFITGIVLSCFNFAQLPFWTGWSIYLINSKYVSPQGWFLQLAYIGSSIVGTFCGIVLFVSFLNQLSINASSAVYFIMAYGIPAVFVILAVYNAFLFYKKYYRQREKKAEV